MRYLPSDVLHIASEKVKQIDFDFSEFDIQKFVQWVADKRGMSIQLEACDALAFPVGFWFMSDDGAHVMYSSTLNPMLKTVTILHELMHIYLGHTTVYIPRGVALYPDKVAARNTSKQNDEDIEAEMAALLLYHRCMLGDHEIANVVSAVFDAK